MNEYKGEALAHSSATACLSINSLSPLRSFPHRSSIQPALCSSSLSPVASSASLILLGLTLKKRVSQPKSKINIPASMCPSACATTVSCCFASASRLSPSHSSDPLGLEPNTTIAMNHDRARADPRTMAHVQGDDVVHFEVAVVTSS